MSRYILEITDDSEAELIDEDTDESLWSSYDDDDFDGDPCDSEAVIEYLVKKDIIESENDVVEIIDETGEFEAVEMGDDDESDEESDDD